MGKATVGSARINSYKNSLQVLGICYVDTLNPGSLMNTQAGHVLRKGPRRHRSPTLADPRLSTSRMRRLWRGCNRLADSESDSPLPHAEPICRDDQGCCCWWWWWWWCSMRSRESLTSHQVTTKLAQQSLSGHTRQKHTSQN